MIRTLSRRQGRCGHQVSAPMPSLPGLCCELPAGHAGWHKDGDAEWVQRDIRVAQERPTPQETR